MVEHTAELQSYIDSWRFAKTPRTQVIEELASYSLETKHIPDPYSFLITPSGELISLVTGDQVKKIVNTDSYIGQTEMEALVGVERIISDVIERDDQDPGPIIWMSPEYPGAYLDLKVVVSEIVGRGKNRSLFNRAIILDLNKVDTLKFAQGLTNYSTNKVDFTSLEDIRRTPIQLNPGLHWSYIFEELVADDQFQMVREGADLLAKKRAIKQGKDLFPVLFSGEIKEVVYADYFGEFNGSCPVIPGSKTAFSYVFDNSLSLKILKKKDWECDRDGDCTGCSKKNTKVGPCSWCQSCQDADDRRQHFKQLFSVVV